MKWEICIWNAWMLLGQCRMIREGRYMILHHSMRLGIMAFQSTAALCLRTVGCAEDQLDWSQMKYSKWSKLMAFNFKNQEADWTPYLQPGPHLQLCIWYTISTFIILIFPSHILLLFLLPFLSSKDCWSATGAIHFRQDHNTVAGTFAKGFVRIKSCPLPRCFTDCWEKA